MAEVVCDSKSFTITLIAPEVIITPRIEILDKPTKLAEGKHLEVDVRIHNDGTHEMEICHLGIWDSKGQIEEKETSLGDNIVAGGHKDYTLSTWGLSRDMPGHAWAVIVKACARKAAYGPTLPCTPT